MDERTQIYNSMFSKLVIAMKEQSGQPTTIASAEVLGYTGSWLSSLTAKELVTLQQAIAAQLMDTLR